MAEENKTGTQVMAENFEQIIITNIVNTGQQTMEEILTAVGNGENSISTATAVALQALTTEANLRIQEMRDMKAELETLINNSLAGLNYVPAGGYTGTAKDLQVMVENHQKLVDNFAVSISKNYLKLSGGTLTGKLIVKSEIEATGDVVAFGPGV
ncbi:MAG: hypothetical protein ACRC5T_11285 [Cetobacterium sp.]